LLHNGKTSQAGQPATARGPARHVGTVRHDGGVGISVDELVSYVERAVGQMADIVGELGDDLANRRPALPGANSPYVILRHCLGVMEFWGGQVVAGRTVQRDRAAEFRASGPVAALIAATRDGRAAFRADAAKADPGAPPRGTHPSKDRDELETRTQGTALLHVLEEVTQHLGQMELTRDVLRNGGAA
jgi:Protein of unknown function (DUF664)